MKCQLALVLLALRSCSQAAIVTGQCVACHGILGMGDGTNPRMAGQSRGYVLKTLQEFQSKVRGNNPLGCRTSSAHFTRMISLRSPRSWQAADSGRALSG